MHSRFALVIALGASLTAAACTDPDNERRVLSEDGYSNIELLGTPWFAGCGKDDFYADEFRATSSSGHRVHGVVCSGFGWGKATTIRRY